MRISLVFMGDGPDAEMLKNRARSLRSVHFLGYLPDITNHIAALDAFIFPSRKEGLGSVLLDVMRCRTPIIATNVGGIPDLITDDQTGILCASGNAEQLSQKIKGLLSSKEKMQSIKDNAYKKSREYAPQIMAGKYLNIYQRITLSH
jgi:glycosyltransferase involved in cell wall biosynthesis